PAPPDRGQAHPAGVPLSGAKKLVCHVGIPHFAPPLAGFEPAFWPKCGQIKIFQTKFEKKLAQMRRIWYHKMHCIGSQGGGTNCLTSNLRRTALSSLLQSGPTTRPLRPT